MKYKGNVVDSAFIYAVDAKLKEISDDDIFMKGSIYCTLAAAEEVFAEMQPAPVQLQRGDTVTHNLHPKCGKGEVRKLSKSGKTADVYFSGAGWCSPLTKNLTKIEEAQNGEG